MIVMLVTYHCKPGKAGAFLEALRSERIPERTASEPGCLGYDYYLPVGGGDVVLLVEHWPDEEALKLHGTYDHFARVQALKAEYVDHTDFERLAPAER